MPSVRRDEAAHRNGKLPFITPYTAGTDRVRREMPPGIPCVSPRCQRIGWWTVQPEPDNRLDRIAADRGGRENVVSTPCAVRQHRPGRLSSAKLAG
jgi:hypothetical protein